jgi:hypothetical protein
MVMASNMTGEGKEPSGVAAVLENRDKEVYRTLSLLIIFFALCAILSANTAQAADALTSAATPLDIYAKLVGAIVAGLGFLFGIPVTWFTIRKTRFEIKKLELEADNIRANLEKTAQTSDNFSNQVKVQISESPESIVNVTYDPRLAAPLLVLMDFVTAFVLLTVGGYAIDLLLSYFLVGNIAVAVYGIYIGLAIAVVVPLFRRTIQVRGLFSSERDKQTR